MSKVTPTQRSLKLLRDVGYTVAITEHWNTYARVRQDLFGFVDLLAIAPAMIAIQTTSGDNVAARVAKIVTLQSAREWLEAGHKIWVHGWAKRGARGRRKLWTCREVEVTLEECAEGGRRWFRFGEPQPMAVRSIEFEPVDE